MQISWFLFGASSASTYGYKTKVMSTGDIVVAGYTSGSFTDFTSAGSNDFLVQKYSATGTLLWTQQLGSSSFDVLDALDVDTGGNIYVAGYSMASFDGNTYNGAADITFIKFNSSGAKLFSGEIGGTGDDNANGVAVDNTRGYFYIVGYTFSPLFDGQNLTGTADTVWLKYDSATGTKQAHYQSNTTSTSWFTGIGLDSAGDSWIVGYTLASTYLSLTSHGAHDVIVQKLSSNGSNMFVALEGGSVDDYGTAICLDSSDNVYITGYSSSTTIDGQTGHGAYDVLIYKLHNNGTKLFTILAGSSGTDRGFAIAVDEANGVFVVTGSTRSTSFYGNTVTVPQANFLLTFAMSEGTRIYAAVYSGSSRSSNSFGIAVGNNMVYTTGFTTQAYFGQPLTGTQDGYLLAIGSSPTAVPTMMPTMAPSPAPANSTRTTRGAMIGIIVGVVLVVGLICSIVFYFFRQRQKAGTTVYADNQQQTAVAVPVENTNTETGTVGVSNDCCTSLISILLISCSVRLV